MLSFPVKFASDQRSFSGFKLGERVSNTNYTKDADRIQHNLNYFRRYAEEKKYDEKFDKHGRLSTQVRKFGNK
jgi:hypothetical protein